jgi:hypothetical protein
MGFDDQSPRDPPPSDDGQYYPAAQYPADEPPIWLPAGNEASYPPSHPAPYGSSAFGAGALPRKGHPARNIILSIIATIVLLGIVGAIAENSSKSTSTASATTSAIEHLAATGAATSAPATSSLPAPATPAPLVTTSQARPPATSTVATTHAPPIAPVTTHQAPAPVPVTTAAPPPVTTAAPPPTTAAPVGCHPLTNAGKCYEPGEFCRVSDHGMTGVAGDGEAIKCEDNDGWRWEPI